MNDNNLKIPKPLYEDMIKEIGLEKTEKILAMNLGFVVTYLFFLFLRFEKKIFGDDGLKF